MPTAYSYIRFSSPQQVRGDSLRRQLKLSQDYAARHGLTIDESLSLRDLGVSAFRGRNATQGALSAFIQAVDSGKVRKGSMLVIESLDRLSRNEVGEALELFLSLLRKGISIVTLNPEQKFTRQSINDVTTILTAIIYMARAHEESATKSVRLSQAWVGKRERAKDKPLTSLCPYWLRLVDGKFEEVPDAVATVKKIFRSALEGVGQASIAKRFTKEGVKHFGKKEVWHKSYITKILHNRSVLGEYQPHVMRDGKRVPHGDPIPNYFPQIIGPQTFYRAQKAMALRATARGPNGKIVANLFTGLLFDVWDAKTLNLIDKGKESAAPTLVSSGALRGEAGTGRYTSRQIEEFFLIELPQMCGIADAPKQMFPYLYLDCYLNRCLVQAFTVAESFTTANRGKGKFSGPNSLGMLRFVTAGAIRHMQAWIPGSALPVSHRRATALGPVSPSPHRP